MDGKTGCDTVKRAKCHSEKGGKTAGGGVKDKQVTAREKPEVGKGEGEVNARRPRSTEV